MRDDDLDLELDDEPAVPVRPAKPVKPAAKPAAEAAAKAVKAAGLKGPGLVDRAKSYVKRPQFNGRMFLTILIALIVLVALAENFGPVRFYFLGLALDLPKSLAFIIDVAIGALLMWLWQKRPAKPTEAGK